MANRRPTKQKDVVDWVNDVKAARTLARGHPKSALITAVATVGNNRSSVKSAGSESKTAKL